MAKRAMAAWKVVGMILLVVIPGGSLLLLAMALYRAYKQGRGPLAWLLGGELRRQVAGAFASVGRWMRFHGPAAAHRA